MAARRPAGSAAELLAHRFHRRRDDVRRRTAPTGMNRGDGAMLVVHQQNGHAVGRLDGDHRAGTVFEQCVALPQNAAAPVGIDDDGGMDLLDGGEILEPGGDVAVTRAETVDQPRQLVEFRNAVNLSGILVEHDYAGFWTWAMRIWLLNSSSIDSSSRTSVGRLTRVVIWSILSCSLRRP